MDIATGSRKMLPLRPPKVLLDIFAPNIALMIDKVTNVQQPILLFLTLLVTLHNRAGNDTFSCFPLA